MLQKRLAQTSEPMLRRTQYGFRPQRSTTQPLFILRSAMEWSLMTDTPLRLLFLDWRQAFDSLDHTAMIQALKLMGTSERMLAVIQSLWDPPPLIACRSCKPMPTHPPPPPPPPTPPSPSRPTPPPAFNLAMTKLSFLLSCPGAGPAAEAAHASVCN